MRVVKLFLLLSLFSLHSFAQEGRTVFSREEVLEDLDYLYESLKDAHYDLFAYTPEARMDSVYKAVEGSIRQDSLNILQATNTLQWLTSAVNNGHTAIEFPIPVYVNYAYAGGTVFPLEIALENNKALVRKNWTDNESIATEDELLSINGVAMKDILQKIYPQISAERPYFKNAKIELYTLPRYYWQVYGQQDTFTVEVRSGDTVNTYTLKSIRALEDYEMKRNDILDPSRKLKYFGETAYLHPGNFSGDESQYRKFIDSAFTDIGKKKSPDLIIDLRNNGGGEDSFSDYLVSYIADKPFRWSSDFTLKTSEFLKEHVRKERDTTAAFWKSALEHENGEVYKYDFPPYTPQPEEKRYTGKVFVLVNRQSHSQSAVTAAQVQDYGFATIVGEETGDFPSLYASIFAFTLPNTGIPVNVSKGRIIRVNGSTKEEGVMPDIYIKDHLLDEEDEVLEYLLKTD